MPTTLKTRLPPQSLSNLQHLSSLLHLIHHRNHNQHRRSPWYRHFSIFRRQLNLLIESYTTLAAVPDTHLGKHRKKAQDVLTTAAVLERLVFWQDVLVPKAHHAFSQLVADGRFAVTGVVLLAILAQACGIVGISAAYEEMGQVEMEKVLERFGREEWGDQEESGGLVAREDLGQVLMREAVGDEVMEDVSSAISTRAEMEVPATEAEKGSELGRPLLEDEPAQVSSTPTPNLQDKSMKKEVKDRKASKKKRKRDAIDDLFSDI